MQKVNAFTWDKLPEEEKPIAQVPGQVMKPVKPADFPPPSIPWNRSVTTVVGPRTDPVLLPPADLEVWADSGLWAIGDRETADRKKFAMIKEAEKKRKERERERELANKKNNRNNRAGENTLFGRGGEGYGATGGGSRRARTENNSQRKEEVVVLRPRAGVKLTGVEDVKEISWVTVLARVPIKQQYQLYDDALQNSRGYAQGRDIPSYVGYVVQRAEVTDVEQGQWKTIETVTRNSLTKKMKRWPANPAEVIDNKYSHPLLTHPLPPLLLRDWGEHATHSEMPLVSLERARRTGVEEPKETTEEESEEEVDEFAFGTESVRGGMRGRAEDRATMGRGRVPGGYGGEGGMGYGGEGGMGYGGDGRHGWLRRRGRHGWLWR